MGKTYTPATFQPTVRPSWAGILSYISEKERSDILEAIIKYPNDTGIDSKFWQETIKPDLDEQYDKFLKICEVRGRSAKTYWGEHKLSISNTKVKQKDNLLKDKDKDKDKDKVKDKNKDKDNLYGELNNVHLTEEQYLYLKEKHPELDQAIEVLDTWLGKESKAAKEARGKNHYAYFKSNSWVWDSTQKSKQKTNTGNPNGWSDEYMQLLTKGL